MSKRFFSEYATDCEDGPAVKTLSQEPPLTRPKLDDGRSLATIEDVSFNSESPAFDGSANTNCSSRDVSAVHPPESQQTLRQHPPSVAESIDLVGAEEKDVFPRKMMEFQLISDIHIEHHENFQAEDFIVPCAPIIALLGDIGNVFDPRFHAFIQWCSEQFELVLFVPGNHDFYTHHKSFTIQYIKDSMKQFFSLFYNVIMLDNQCHEYRDVLFIGSTLWSHVPIEHHQELAAGGLNDYQFIYSSANILFTPQHSSNLFKENVNFIEWNIADASLRGLKPVVLTHHVPSFKKTADPFFADRPSNHAFASQVNFDERPFKPVLWCAGHTHFNFDHEEEGYRLVSNQLGYPKKKASKFRKNFVLFV